MFNVSDLKFHFEQVIKKMKLNLVIAACHDGGIGLNGTIPWRIKRDLTFFREITTGILPKQTQQQQDGAGDQKSEPKKVYMFI